MVASKLDSVFSILPGGLLAVLLAYVLDWLLGDPKWLFGRIGHPVAWIGGLISWLETRLRDPKASQEKQMSRGVILAAIVVFLSVAAGNLIEVLAAKTGYGWIIVGIIGAVFIAARGLLDHVREVANALDQGLEQGRAAVGRIVGRDPDELDEGGISRAALESLAENFSDGVVAPLFWFILCGLPGLLAYKAINTMDSMIGHRSERYLYFGRFAARLDDVANWPAARITAFLLCLGALILPGMGAGRAWRTMWRDHSKQISPNAGWPEAAMAGALNVALAGPRIYYGKPLDGEWIGDGRQDAGRIDIRSGCKLYICACALIGLGLFLAILL